MISVDNSVTNQVPTKGANKELIFFVITLVGFVAIILIYLFFFLRSNQTNKPAKVVERPDTQFYELNQANEEIKTTKDQPVGVVLTDLDFPAGDFRPLSLVLKGYTDTFNPIASELKVKNQVTNSEILQLLSFNTSHLQNFFCWPKTLPGPDGPMDIRTIEQGLSSPDAIIYNPDEKVLPMQQLESLLKPNGFVIMQLEEGFSLEKTNFIKKLVLIDC